MSICGGCSNFEPEPIDLRTWTEHLYPEILNDCEGSTFGANWNVRQDGNSVRQTINGQQTMFCSPFKIFDDDDAFDFFSGPVTFTGRVRVEEPPTDEERDNDYWGFALGFNAGDAGPLDGGSGIDANYILIDWKRGDQRYSNSCREEDPEDGTCPRYPGYDPNEPPEEGENVPVPQCKPVQCQIRLDENDLPDEWNQATEGLAASQVLGLAHADLMWSHVVCPAEDNSQGDFSTGFIEELVRGRRFGNVGWEYYDTKEWYDFRFDISSDVIRVYVDDCENPELVIRARDLIGRNEFNNGHFCFYNYSQENVRYTGFTAEPNCSEEDVSPDGPDGGKGKGGKGKGYSSSKSSKSSSKSSKSGKGGGKGKRKRGRGKGGGKGGGKGKRKGGHRKHRRHRNHHQQANATDPAPGAT